MQLNARSSHEKRTATGGEFSDRECSMVLARYVRVCERQVAQQVHGLCVDLFEDPCMCGKTAFWEKRQKRYVDFREEVKPLCIEASFRSSGSYANECLKNESMRQRAIHDARAIVARSKQTADIDALIKKFSGREDQLVVKLREKFSDGDPVPYEDSLVTVESSFAFRSGSFTGNTDSSAGKVFIHVWRYHAEGKRFVAAFERAWQVAFDLRLSGVVIPISVLVNCQNTYVTATTCVPLLKEDTVKPNSVMASISRLLGQKTINEDPIVLREGTDGLLHLVDPLPFLVPLENGSTTDADRQGYERVELWSWHPQDATDARPTSTSERLHQSISSSSVALLRECESRLQSGSNAGEVLDASMQDSMLLRLLHRVGVSMHMALHVLVRVTATTSEAATVAARIIQHEMVCRTIKELVRSLLWDSDVYRGTVCTTRRQLDEFRSKIVGTALQKYALKLEEFDDLLLPTLRAKFDAPAEFVIPRERIMPAVLFRACCKHLLAEFNPTTKKLESTLKSSVAMGTTFRSRFKSAVFQGTVPTIPVPPEAARGGTLLQYAHDVCTHWKMGEAAPAWSAVTSRFMFRHASVNPSISATALRSLVSCAALADSQVDPDTANALKECVRVTVDSLSPFAKETGHSPAYVSLLCCDVARAARLLRDKGLLRDVRAFFVRVVINSTTDLPAVVKARFAEALPHFRPSDDELRTSLPNVLRIVFAQKVSTLTAAAVEVLGNGFASMVKNNNDSTAIDAWGSYGLAVSQACRRQVGEGKAITLMSITYWAYFVLLRVRAVSSKGALQRDDDRKSLNERELSSLSAFEEVSQRIHASDEKDRKRLLGSDHFIRTTASFADVLMDNGEWVAGRALATLCSRMIVWNPSLSAETCGVVSDVNSRISDAKVATTTLSRVLQRRRRRRGGWAAISDEDVHRRGVELVQHWERQRLAANRISSRFLMVKLRLSVTLDCIASCESEQIVARHEIDLEEEMHYARLSVLAREIASAVELQGQESCAWGMITTVHEEHIARDTLTRDAIELLGGGSSQLYSSLLSNVIAAETVARIDSDAEYIQFVESAGRIQIVHRWQQTWQHRLADNELGIRRALITDEACARLQIEECSHRAAVHQAEPAGRRQAVHSAEAVTRERIGAVEDTEFMNVLHSHLRLTQHASLSTIATLEAAERGDLERVAWSEFPLATCLHERAVTTAEVLLREHVTATYADALAAASQRADMYVRQLTMCEMLGREEIGRWAIRDRWQRTVVGALQHEALRTKWTALSAWFGFGTILLSKFEGMTRRQLMHSTFADMPFLRFIYKAAGDRRVHLVLHEQFARSAILNAAVGDRLRLLMVHEFLQRRRILSFEARERVPPWAVKASVVAQFEAATRRRFTTDCFDQFAEMAAAFGLRSIRFIRNNLWQQAAHEAGDLLAGCEGLKRWSIRELEASARSRVLIAQEASSRRILWLGQSRSFWTAALPLQHRTIAHDIALQTDLAARQLLMWQVLHQRGALVAHFQTVIRDCFYVACMGTRYRHEFDESIVREHLMRLVHCQRVALLVRESEFRRAIQHLTSLHVQHTQQLQAWRDEAFARPEAVRFRRKIKVMLDLTMAVEDDSRRELCDAERTQRIEILVRERDFRRLCHGPTERVALPPLRSRRKPVSELLFELQDVEQDARCKVELQAAQGFRELLVLRKRQGRVPKSAGHSRRDEATTDTNDASRLIMPSEHVGDRALITLGDEAVAALDSADTPPALAGALRAVSSMVTRQRRMFFHRHAQMSLDHPMMSQEESLRKSIGQVEQQRRAALRREFNAVLGAYLASVRRGQTS